MKNVLFFFCLILVVQFSVVAQTNSFPTSGSVGIGTITPSSSSILEMNSTTQGILVPRMTKAERDAIISPAIGLLIYQINSQPGFYYYNGTWKAIKSAAYTSGSGISIIGTSISNTSPDQIVSISGDGATSVIGTYPNFTISSTDSNTTYISGDGIDIASNIISNISPDQIVSLDAGPGISITGIYPTFSITNTGDTAIYDDANSSLSNLDSTEINQTLSPNISATFSLGSDTKMWNHIYIDGKYYLDGNVWMNNLGTRSVQLFNSTNTSNVANDNFFAGDSSGAQTTSGGSNIFIGTKSGTKNTTGIQNTVVGVNAGYRNIEGNNNCLFGYGAGNKNIASYNSFFGMWSGYSTTSGNANTFYGYYSGKNNTTGAYNTFIGESAGANNTTGTSNIFIGRNAGYSNIDKSYNTCIGVSSAYSITGAYNSFLGYNTGLSSTSTDNNTLIGYQSGYQITTGDGNTIVGSNAGATLIDGINNTLIGYNNDVSSASISNATAIGHDITITASNSFVFGNTSVTRFGFGKNSLAANIFEIQGTSAKLTVGGVWTDASDKKLKANFNELDKKEILDKINQLEISKWNYKADNEATKHIGPMADQFYHLFTVGDDSTIAAMDKAGVALIGIQQLSEDKNEMQKSIIELQTIIEKQQANLDMINAKLEQQELIESMQNALNEEVQLFKIPAEDQIPRLDQNIPNPFSDKTRITYFAPTQSKLVQIKLTATNGRVLFTATVSAGEGIVEFDASLMQSGIYTYSLVIDGKLEATNQLVISK